MKWMITAAVLVAVISGAVGVGFWRFNRQARQETEALMAKNTVVEQMINEEMIKDLPVSVQRWLQNSGILGREAVHTVHLRQKGTMRLKPDQNKWMASDAEQFFTVDTPGFIWRVRTAMAGMPVLGRDLFSDGQGSMEIRLAGLIPVVNVSNHERINESTIQRYLGETVWFPSAALSPYIQWEPVDEFSAKATMTHGSSSGSAVFHFNEQGEVTQFVAHRYRDINDEIPTEWVATVKETTTVNGINIPTKLEAAWMLEDGPFTWYIFEIDDVVYNQGM
jgi:hypothetical protein